VVLIGVRALAQVPGSAVVYTSGVVLVNGKIAPATTALFQGDTLQTTNGASAVIVSPGASISMPENSQLQLQPKGIQVKSGTASVSTSKGTSLHANGYDISPADSASTYAVAVSGNGLKVASQTGALQVSGATGSLTVASGSSRLVGSTASTSSLSVADAQANAPLTLVSPGTQTIIPITGICPNSIHCGFH
jgi:hypothetical protein